MKSLVLLLSFSVSLSALASTQYLGFRHLHTGSSHKALNYMKSKVNPYLNKGRVQVYTLKDSNFELSKAPKYVQEQFFSITLEDLVNTPTIQKNKKDKNLSEKLQPLRINHYKNFVTSLVGVGNRSKGGEAKEYIIGELRKMNLTPIRSDYNIVSKIEGTSSKSIVIIGHMDTVSRTVGADDNASGASGVLELARVLSKEFSDKKPTKSIYFVLSENEEDGLLGAKKFVKRLKKSGELKKIELSINMDMIAYNSNGIVDLETNKKIRT